MSITLTYLSTTVTLDPDLTWPDELMWYPVEQSVERSITGAMIVSVSTRVAGRPITLAPENDSASWMPRSVIDTLKSWAAIAGAQMTLSLRGINHTVIFRHQDGAIDARPVTHFSDVDSADRYLATLRFTEV